MVQLVHGQFYCNGRGDELGPMDERAPGVFLDQYGRLYHPDGRQWDHVPGSTGNVYPAPIVRAAGSPSWAVPAGAGREPLSTRAPPADGVV